MEGGRSERAAPKAPREERPPATAQPDATEPAGEQDAGNEAKLEEATERAEAADDVEPRGSPDEASSADGAVSEVAAEADAGSAEAGDRLAAAVRERDEYLELAQRRQADFENYRKRAAKEAAAAGERAKGGLVRELLPVVDNLERALSSAGPEQPPDEAERHFAEGVRLVHSELLAVLQRNGVEPFDPRGEAFDPSVHEALSTRAGDGAEPGVVLEVVEKGYKLNGNVLRPARVVVSG